MKISQSTIFIIIIIVLVVGAIGVYVMYGSAPASPAVNYDAFATCLKDKGATFYGAFWCPHCKAQKALFGSSVDLLPYVECSTPDGNGQTQICKDKNIEGYPTWIFADGSQLSGEIPLATLAQKTGCTLPSGATTPSTASSASQIPATSAASQAK
jgi:thiol-disulfide isomerase/thioredoxin